MHRQIHKACQNKCFKAQALSLVDVSVYYGKRLVLEDVNINFSLGQFSAIIGPNGAGKSTMMKSILGLIPFQGSICYDCQSEICPHTAYVPQQQSLDWAFPVTVWETVMMGRTGRLGIWSWPKKDDKLRVKKALEQMDVYNLRDRHIADLSGGQRQRVLLARMLARDAAILLLDEPLTGVDNHTGDHIITIMQEQAKEGRAVIMVTHDLEQAVHSCDYLIMLNKKVIAQGIPKEIYQADNIEATFSTSFVDHKDKLS